MHSKPLYVSWDTTLLIHHSESYPLQYAQSDTLFMPEVLDQWSVVIDFFYLQVAGAVWAAVTVIQHADHVHAGLAETSLPLICCIWRTQYILMVGHSPPQ